MDSLSEADRVFGILLTRDDPEVRIALSVEVLEVGMVVCQNSAHVGTGVGENFGVVYTLATATGLLDRDHVMPETTEFLDDAKRKILVST
jgi:hypothetical protein